MVLALFLLCLCLSSCPLILYTQLRLCVLAWTLAHHFTVAWRWLRGHWRRAWSGLDSAAALPTFQSSSQFNREGRWVYRRLEWQQSTRWWICSYGLWKASQENQLLCQCCVYSRVCTTSYLQSCVVKYTLLHTPAYNSENCEKSSGYISRLAACTSVSFCVHSLPTTPCESDNSTQQPGQAQVEKI